MNTEHFSLAELVDWLALPEGPRDRALVLRTVGWLHEHRDHLELQTPVQCAWHDVLLTLQVQEQVSAVLTGRRDDVPGEWTWKVAQRDFPDVWLYLRAEPVPEPAGYAAVDYAVQGRPVQLPTGDTAVAQASLLIEGEQKLRVRNAAGQLRVFERGDVQFLDQPDPQ